jgi:hypothetical protein
MRKIFTSPRLENVERVAEMLKENGVDARITNGRSYKGAVRGHFTYRDHARSEQQPTVWIVKPDDQPKARELMRAAGLLDSGRSPTSYLATETLIGARDADIENATKQRVLMMKMALLIGIAFAIGIGLLAWRKPAPSTTPAVALPGATIAGKAPPAPATISDSFGAAYRADVPSALAAMLLQAELSAHEATAVCLSVDGADAPERILSQLQAAERARIRSQAACTAAKDAKDVVSVAVREYRTDGSGTGTVQVEIADRDKDGKPRVDTRTLEVKRDGLQWEVKRVVLSQ